MSFVGHAIPTFHFGQIGTNAFHEWDKRRMKHDSFSIRIVKEVCHLFGSVAIIGIGRDQATLECSDVRL